MDRLAIPLRVAAVYNILIGLIVLSPALVRSVFGYELKDPGAALLVAIYGLSFGIVVWSIAANPTKYGGLAGPVVVTFVLGVIMLLWGWLRETYTVRNVGLPIVINLALAAWIWSARQKG